MMAAVVRGGQTVYYEKFGWMDIETQRPIQDDTIFMIASMTKPITAVASMMLFVGGYFHLNTPVSEFIPGFKDVKVISGHYSSPDDYSLTDLDQKITFRHLFTHTSGLSYGWDENDAVDSYYQIVQKRYEEEGIPFTNRSLVEELWTPCY